MAVPRPQVAVPRPQVAVPHPQVAVPRWYNFETIRFTTSSTSFFLAWYSSIRGQPVLVVGDGDGILAPAALVLGRHGQDPILIDLECDINLGYPARGGRDETREK